MIRTALLALGLALGAVSPGWAQAVGDYPSRPVHFIVPFAAGGGTDALSRILGEAVGRRLGQAVVVENLGGAGGTIGVNQVARAEPDGYTMLTATPSIVITPYLQKGVAYDVARDFAAVIQATASPSVLVVPPESPIRTVADLVAAARAKPGQVRYGTAGVGSFAHLSTALFGAMAGVRLVHVPYRGTGPALIDLLAGRLQFQLENAPGVLAQIHSGQLRAVAVGTARASTLLPGLPTVAADVPGYESSSWYGVLVPSRTPVAIVAKLNAVFNDALGDPVVQAQMAGLGVERVGGAQLDFDVYLKARLAEMKAIAQTAGLVPQ